MKLRKKLIALSAAALSMAMIMPVFADNPVGWRQTGNTWQYVKDASGSLYSNGWQWLDGNKDGVSECYYFDANGNMLSNTTTPDGWQVNEGGAWIMNGVVQTKGAATQATDTNTKRPSSKEIIDYLYRGHTDKSIFYDHLIDTSRPEWNNGVTNLKMIEAVGAPRWSHTHGGWYYLGYDNTDVEAIALNDEGYLLADTITPDGYYVNKRGVLEIDGREVTHCEECLYTASSVNVPDPNHMDLSKYNDWEIGIGHSWRMSSMPYGKLIYNHVTGMDREQGGIGSNILSHNDFGVCAVWDAENSYKHTKK